MRFVILLFYAVLLTSCNEKKPFKSNDYRNDKIIEEGKLGQSDYVLDYNAQGFEVYYSNKKKPLTGTFNLMNDGKVYETISLKDGLLHGEYKLYKIDGSLGLIVNYDNGERIGEAKKYYPDGSIEAVEIYEDNKVIQETAYNEKGEIVFVRKKVNGFWESKFIDNGKIVFEEYDKMVNGQRFGITKVVNTEKGFIHLYGFKMNASGDEFQEDLIYIFDRNHRLIDSLHARKDSDKIKQILGMKNSIRKER